MRLQKLSRLLWALTLVSLPITSFRYLPFMGAGTVVRPLALYPLAALLLVLFIMLLRREIRFPRLGSATVLTAFVLAAIAATALGATLAPIELRGADYWERALRAFVTLAIGLSFFVAAAWMNQNQAQVKFSVRWLMVGLLGHLVWGAVQFYGLNHGYRAELREFQELFSVRGLVKNKRISGFTFEPSWLAAQLATLYLPWLVAGLLNPKVFSKSFGLWANLLLLLGSLAALLATYSRSGLAVVALAAGISVVVAGRPFLQSAWGWFLAGFRDSAAKSRLNWIQAAGSRALLILVAIGVIAGAGAFLSDKGYIARLWTSDRSDFWGYISSTSLGPRIAYAAGAMPAFDFNPLSGVGLGASGFWIYPNMPDELLMGEPEIAAALAPRSGLFPNPKNLYVRLLAETGLAGLTLFLAFWLGILADGLAALRRTSVFSRFLGAAAVFTLTALVFQSVSIDSFALPELWLNLGILAGIFSRSEK
ncbi:MAG: O-antigen ligase family protein [Anaerolineales bacterium]|jgi:O-antigen ligase|nr:O-antigen ligase family protein [Anaerolineales bacterium]